VSKVLILTVGGSWEPLVTSIQRHRSDYVVFLCSQDGEKPDKRPGSHIMVDGKGLPCTQWGKEAKPSIVAQCGLEPEQYEKIIISGMDSLADCYFSAEQAIKNARDKFSGADILCDYTGGTKSMSAGLAAAALDDGKAQIYLVGGRRDNLVKVRSGTQRVVKGDWSPLLWQRRFDSFKKLFARYDYEGCLELTEQLSTEVVADSKADRIVEVYRSLSRAFLNWDQFRHEDAMDDLEPYVSYLPQQKIFLSEVIKSRKIYEEGHGEDKKVRLHMVYDILRNAERRLLQKKFDDAVSRIYRALEMIAQLCLFFNRPSIDTSRVDLNALPEGLKDKYRQIKEDIAYGNMEHGDNNESKMQVGLFRAYELLSDLGHPVGKLAWERKGRMLDIIRVRNFSILAHGLEPIEPAKAKEFYRFTCDLLKQGEKELKN